MPSRATKAAEAIEKDQAAREAAERTTSSGAKLHAVPDTSKGDQARAAVVAQLPEHQRAAYEREIAAGTRHVTALAAARKAPAPDVSTADVEAQAAALFAAFGAGQGGAAAPPVTVPAAAGKPVHDDPDLPAASAAAADRRADTKPAAPKPPVQAKPATPKPAAPKPPRPAPAPVGSCDRHIGVVTATGLDGNEQTYDCAHGATNGHMTTEAAESCAKKLLRNHPTGTAGTRLHPVRRDLNGRRITA